MRAKHAPEASEARNFPLVADWWRGDCPRRRRGAVGRAARERVSALREAAAKLGGPYAEGATLLPRASGTPVAKCLACGQGQGSPRSPGPGLPWPLAKHAS